MTAPKNLTPEEFSEWKAKKLTYIKEWCSKNEDKVKKNKRKYYEKNKQKVIDAAKKWAENNKEKSLASARKSAKNRRRKGDNYSKEYYLHNREKLLIYHANYRKNNPDKVRDAVRKSQNKNPLRLRIAKYVRRMRERSSGRVSTQRVQDLIIIQNNKCVYCGVELHEFHVDHILPLALGGLNDDSNVQLLCPRCNRKKGAKHPDEFRLMLGNAT